MYNKRMTVWTLTFLGPPRFTRDGAPVMLTQAKATALLVYLAVTRVAQPRERLADLLWPESLPQAARKNMRNILWSIGETLGADVLIHDGPTLQLAPDVSVDVHALEDALLSLESGAAAQLEAAAALYHGPLADGLAVHEASAFELWLVTERERLAAVYLRLLERTIELQRAAGNWQAVVVYAQLALGVEPLQEATHLALIEAYMQLGHRAQATHQYAALADLLRRDLDVAPLPETVARYEALLAGGGRSVMQSSPTVVRPPEPPALLVGREAEIAALNAERERAAQGAARIVLLSGDLGMGKTHLWRTWVSAHASNALLLTTYALETSTPVPFGPLVTLFNQPGPAQALLTSPGALAPIWLSELARLLPSVTTQRPELPSLALTPTEERVRLLQALSEVIRTLATRLLILVVDDLHWADPSTIDWLVYLVDYLRDVPLLLLGAYRPQEAPERLLRAVAGWQRQGKVRSVVLPHLTLNESLMLLAGLGLPQDHPQAAGWAQQSGGNPYFLSELWRSSDGEAQSDLMALVRSRLEMTAPASAAQVLQAAAVLGDNATFAAIRATSRRNEEETLDALDTLEAVAVLVPRDNGTYHFVHPLVASVVRQDLSPARRSFLHRRAAEALERIHAPRFERVAVALMQHYAAAGEGERAARYAEQAAEQALAVSGFVEALSYARRAMECQPTPQRQLLLGEALIMAGDRKEAQFHLEAAAQSFAQTADQVGSVRAYVALATIAITAIQPHVARAWLERAPAEQIEAREGALSVRVHVLWAIVERESQAYAAAEAHFQRAAELAQKHRLPALETQIAFERGNVLANRGNLPAALSMFDTALQLALESHNPLYTVLAQNSLAFHTLLAGNSARAQGYIREAIATAERYALGSLWQYLYSTDGEIALARGELDAADHAFAQAFAVAEQWDNQTQMANVRINQAMVAQARDDDKRAQTLVRQAQDLFGTSLDPFVAGKIARVTSELGEQIK